MLVTFSGLDGAGKTTQIHLLNTYLYSLGHRVTVLAMYDRISVSASLRRSLNWLLRQNSPQVSSGKRFRYDKNRSDSLTVLLRQAVYFIDLWRFLIVRSYLEHYRHEILVMDRYFYDSIANIASKTGWKALYARCFLALVPKPDLPILLDLDAHTAFQRKPEYPLEYMIQRRQFYFQIFHSVPAALVVWSEKTPEAIHGVIKEHIKAILKNGRN